MSAGKGFPIIRFPLLADADVLFRAAEFSDLPWPWPSAVILQDQVDNDSRTDDDRKDQHQRGLPEMDVLHIPVRDLDHDQSAEGKKITRKDPEPVDQVPEGLVLQDPAFA